MVDAISDWFAGAGEEFFLKAVKILERMYEKCIHMQWDYVEN